jgi:hypothetical protein
VSAVRLAGNVDPLNDDLTYIRPVGVRSQHELADRNSERPIDLGLKVLAPVPRNGTVLRAVKVPVSALHEDQQVRVRCQHYRRSEFRCCLPDLDRNGVIGVSDAPAHNVVRLVIDVDTEEVTKVCVSPGEKREVVRPVLLCIRRLLYIRLKSAGFGANRVGYCGGIETP